MGESLAVLGSIT